METNLTKEEIKEKTGVDLAKVKMAFGVSKGKLYILDLNGDEVGQALFGDGFQILGEIKPNT